MVEVSIEGATAVFAVQGMHKFWTFKSRLEIPLVHISDVEVNVDQVGRYWHGFRVAGTDVPGHFAGGTFYFHGELVFWDVTDVSKTVIVSLTHERYRKLILEVADPQAVVGTLQSALGRR